MDQQPTTHRLPTGRRERATRQPAARRLSAAAVVFPISPGPILPGFVVDQAGGRSPLESYVLVTVLAVLALASIAAMVRWSRQWRPLLRRAAWTVPAVLVLLTLGAGVNSYVGYVRSVDDLGRLALLTAGGNADEKQLAVPASTGPHNPADVRVTDVPLPDPALGIPSGRTRVLLPPGYDSPANAGRRYPVVYLVHGFPSGGPDDWLSGGGAVQTQQALLRARAAQPMIIVAVDATAGSGNDWECLNVPHGPQLQTYLSQYVPQQVDARFRTRSDRGDRAIGGMSGGAFCALNMGLRQQNQYSVILDTEPEDDPGPAGSQLLAGRPDELRANTPRDYMRTIPIQHPMALMLHAGVVAESDVDLAHWIADQLAPRGVRVALREEPGEWHTWRTARIALPYLLKFADEHFAGNHQPGPAATRAGR